MVNKPYIVPYISGNTLYKIRSLTKTTTFNWGTRYYLNQECDDFFDRLGKSNLIRICVLQSSV